MGRSASAWRYVPLLWLAACPIQCDESLGVAPGSQRLIMEVESISNPFDPRSSTLELVPAGTSGSQVSVRIARNTVNAPKSLEVLLSTGPLPPGVTGTFDRPVLTFAGGAATTAFTLSLTASGAALSGPFLVEIVATATESTLPYSITLVVAGEIVRPFRLRVNGPAPVVETGTTGRVSVEAVQRPPFEAAPALRVDQATLPAGTLVTLPAVASAIQDLFFAVPSSAGVGTYRVRVVGTYGANADTLDVPLTVSAPPAPSDFTLGVQPSAATARPGGTSSFAITLSRMGSVGDVALAASGLPAGATATFTPTVASGSSAQLLITTAGSTPDGTYPVVITGTAGTLVRQATISLTVATPPDFTLAASPAALTIARGGTGQSTLALQRTGSVGAVQLAVSGAPAGVTATVTPSTTSGASATLSVAVGTSVAPGTYPLVVTGTAGSIVRTATVTLTVPAPPPSLVSIQLLASAVTVASGATATIPVRLVRTGSAVGQQLELRVAGLPPGGTAWVTPSFTTGDTATLQIVGGTVGTSTIAVSAVVGAVPPTALATVNVVAASTPDFSLVPSVTTLSLVRSGPFTPISLDIRRVAGFSGTVSVAAITDQPGAYAVNVTPGSTAGSNVLVEVYASELVPPGVHVLVLRGTSGGVVRTAQVTLVVR